MSLSGFERTRKRTPERLNDVGCMGTGYQYGDSCHGHNSRGYVKNSAQWQVHSHLISELYSVLLQDRVVPLKEPQ